MSVNVAINDGGVVVQHVSMNLTTNQPTIHLFEQVQWEFQTRKALRLRYETPSVGWG